MSDNLTTSSVIMQQIYLRIRDYVTWHNLIVWNVTFRDIYISGLATYTQKRRCVHEFDHQKKNNNDNPDFVILFHKLE